MALGGTWSQHDQVQVAGALMWYALTRGFHGGGVLTMRNKRQLCCEHSMFPQ